MRWSLATLLALMLLSHLAATSEFGTWLDYKVAQHSEYKLRDKLSRSPALTPQLKIFAFSDKDLTVFNRTDLYIHEWAHILASLAARKPRAIVIDKVFTHYLDPLNKIKASIKKLASLDVPIIVGSFTSHNKIDFSHQFNFDRRYYHLSEFAKSPLHPLLPSGWAPPAPLTATSGAPLPGSQLTLADVPKLRHYDSLNVYGPHSTLAEQFKLIGSLNYNGNLKFYPWIGIKPDRLLPHATLLLANSLDVNASGLFVDGKVLPVAADGQASYNLISLNDFFKRIRHFVSLFRAETYESINPGDTVVLLPNMHTGGTDFHESPFGYVPGGYFLMSAIQSVLTGDWLSVPLEGAWLSPAFSLCGGLLALLAPSLVFWLVLVGFSIIMVGGGLLAFCYASVSLPWLWSELSFGLTALTLFSYRTIYAEKMANMYRLVESQRQHLAEKSQQLSQKTRDLNSMLDNLKLGIFTITANGRIHHEYSKHLEQLFAESNPTSLDPASLLFEQSNIAPARVATLGATLSQCVGSVLEDFSEVRAHAPTEMIRQIRGKSVVYELDWQPIPNENLLTIDKVLVIVRDVTAYKHAHFQLTEMAKWKALGEMSNGISHEINNPLAIILGYTAQMSHFMERQPLNEERIKMILPRVDKAAQRITSIVRQLKMLTHHKLREGLERLSVNALINEALSFSRADLIGQSIQTVVELSENQDLSIVCPKPEFIEVMLVLISNAKDALEGQKNKRLTLAVLEEPSHVIVRVIDNGAGIPTHLHTSIFQPFITGKEVGKGVGLGLSTAKAIVEAMQGDIRVDTQHSQTCFELRLPKALPQV